MTKPLAVPSFAQNLLLYDEDIQHLLNLVGEPDILLKVDLLYRLYLHLVDDGLNEVDQKFCFKFGLELVVTARIISLKHQHYGLDDFTLELEKLVLLLCHIQVSELEKLLILV